MTMFWVMALKPFLAFGLFAVAFLIARGLSKAVPNGRVKDVLFDPGIQKRHPWKFALLGFVTIWGGILVFGFLGSLLHS